MMVKIMVKMVEGLSWAWEELRARSIEMHSMYDNNFLISYVKTGGGFLTNVDGISPRKQPSVQSNALRNLPKFPS